MEHPVLTARQVELMDELFARYGGRLGGDALAYGNHARRVASFCTALHRGTADEQEQIAIAACFHDLGIWPEHTLDYLPPSAALAVAYLTEAGRAGWVDVVVPMIVEHHRLRACAHPLVEHFRRADLVDVSLGLVKAGLPAPLVHAVRARYPNAGFHVRLLQMGARWFVRHPTRPFPFVRV